MRQTKQKPCDNTWLAFCKQKQLVKRDFSWNSFSYQKLLINISYSKDAGKLWLEFRLGLELGLCHVITNKLEKQTKFDN